MPRRDLKPQRTGRRDGKGKNAIVASAMRCFYTHGYFGTSIRDIATEAELTPASLYHHFNSKQDILQVVMTAIMHDALDTTRQALLRAGPHPVDQLTKLMHAWVEFHASRQVEARVGATELHCLDESGRRVVVALRDEQELMFRSVVDRGVAEGAFRTETPREAARAIVNMGTAVATWYHKDGDMSPSELGTIYARLALFTVGAEPSCPPARSSA